MLEDDGHIAPQDCGVEAGRAGVGAGAAEPIARFILPLSAARGAPWGSFRALALEGHLHGSSLGNRLLHLVKMRASQINGCAQHAQPGCRAEGESEQRLYTLAAWCETPFCDERERAALAWTEAVTRVADTHVPDEVHERVKQHFTEQELMDLTLAISQINIWNRLNVAFRTVPGNYRAGMHKEWIGAAEAEGSRG